MLTTDAVGVATVPLLFGVVQAARQAGLDSKFAPLLSIALGMAAGVALQIITPGVQVTGPLIVQGLAIGLSYGLAASGLQSAAKKWTQPDMIPGQAPAQPLMPFPPSTATSGGSQPGFPASNSVPEPAPPPMVP